MASQLENWWLRVSKRLYETPMAMGNRMMVRGATVRRSRDGMALEVRGGEIPIASPIVANLIRETIAADPPPNNLAVRFPELPSAGRIGRLTRS